MKPIVEATDPFYSLHPLPGPHSGSQNHPSTTKTKHNTALWWSKTISKRVISTRICPYVRNMPKERVNLSKKERTALPNPANVANRESKLASWWLFVFIRFLALLTEPFLHPDASDTPKHETWISSVLSSPGQAGQKEKRKLIIKKGGGPQGKTWYERGGEDQKEEEMKHKRR